MFLNCAAGKISEQSTVCQEILILFGLGPIFHSMLAIRPGLIIDIVEYSSLKRV